MPVDWRGFSVGMGRDWLPMVDLTEQSRMAVDELIDVAGRATIEAVSQLSAEQVAGPRTAGQRRTDRPLWHGRQAGRVSLKERKLGVRKPRLREKGGNEVAIPAYEAMQKNGMSQRMLDVLMRGISTRQYAEVLGDGLDLRGVAIERKPGGNGSRRRSAERAAGAALRWDRPALLVKGWRSS